jgi:hypothetical protein
MNKYLKTFLYDVSMVVVGCVGWATHYYLTDQEWNFKTAILVMALGVPGYIIGFFRRHKIK